MVIRPYGYAIWEAIQDDLNVRFKEARHGNMCFPQVRPTSETIVNHMFPHWLYGYHDLPLMINQVIIVPMWKNADEKTGVLNAASS